MTCQIIKFENIDEMLEEKYSSEFQAPLTIKDRIEVMETLFKEFTEEFYIDPERVLGNFAFIDMIPSLTFLAECCKIDIPKLWQFYYEYYDDSGNRID